MKVWFYNTFNPVVPLFDELLPVLQKEGIDAKAYVCEREYRTQTKRTASPYFKRLKIPRLISRWKILTQIVYFISAAFHAAFSRSHLDIYLTQPPFFFVLGALVSRMRSRPYAVHIMDMHPDLMGKLGILRENSILYRFLSQRTVRALGNASFVICIGICMKNLLIRKGIAGSKIHIIRNFVGLLPLVENTSVLEKSTEAPVFRVLYAGNMGRPHDFSSLLETARYFQEAFSEVKFVFIGSGARRGQVERVAKEQELKNIEFHPPLPSREFYKILGKADLHVITLLEGFQGILVPSKYYTSVAMGKPVVFIGPESSEIAEDIHRNRTGYVIKNENSNKLKHLIENLLEEKLKGIQHTIDVEESIVVGQKNEAIDKYTKTIIKSLL